MIKNSCVLIIALALVMASCNSNTEQVDNSVPQKEDSSYTTDKNVASGLEENKESISNPVIIKDTTLLLGYYVGMFEAVKYGKKKDPMYSNKINISIDLIKNKKVVGHSVVAGNVRPFTGTIIRVEEDYIKLKLQEPGNNKYDGVFIVDLYPNDKRITGTWEANDTTLAVIARKFTLLLKPFSYQPELGLTENTYNKVYDTQDYNSETVESITPDASKFNASMVELKSSDVENMYKRDIEVMRNAIYARHGYSFKNRKMRYFFDTNVDWYIPVSTDVSKELTELEKKNIELLKSYEDYAKSYYDSFGR
jgi:hypothetical protein